MSNSTFKFVFQPLYFVNFKILRNKSFSVKLSLGFSNKKDVASNFCDLYKDNTNLYIRHTNMHLDYKGIVNTKFVCLLDLI